MRLNCLARARREASIAALASERQASLRSLQRGKRRCARLGRRVRKHWAQRAVRGAQYSAFSLEVIRVFVFLTVDLR